MSQSDVTYKTPILLIIFNRPDKVRKVMEIIRAIKPARLYVGADGARNTVTNEAKRCSEARLAVTEHIDWPCEIKTRFLNQNDGCHKAVPDAISWVFEMEEKAVIIEDDCLPHASFFPFCEELLGRYENAEKIMSINGSNFQFGVKRGNADYYFSRYPHSWGWATWKRAWNAYHEGFVSFPAFKVERKIERILPYKPAQKFWMGFFEKIVRGKYFFWDALWTYAIFSHEGVVITPNVNMVENIGNGSDSTHTSSKNGIIGQEARELILSTHPISVDINTDADIATYETYFKRTFFQKALYKVGKVFGF